MKKLILLLSFLCGFWAVAAAQTTTSTILTVTNSAGITNGDYLVIQGSTWLVTNSTASLRYVAPTNTAAAATTNFYTKLSAGLSNKYLISYASSTSLALQTYLGQTLTASLSSGWGTLASSTNTAGTASLGASNVTAKSFTLNGETINAWSDLGTASIADGSLTTNKVDATFYNWVASGSWLGMTNYSASYSSLVTNTIVLSGSSTTGVNGTYTYGAGSFTKSGGYGIYFATVDGVYYVTNSGGLLYGTVTQNLLTWEDLGAGGTPPTGYTPTNSVSGSSYADSASYPLQLRSGASGSQLNFGRNVSMWLGEQQNLSGTPFNVADYPSAGGANLDCDFSGTLLSGFSNYRITNSGSRIFTVASSDINANSTNADVSILSAEFGTVRNGQGVALLGAVANFADYSAGGSYSIVGAAGWTNHYMNFASVLGGGIVGSAGASYFDMEGGVGIGTGSSTNISSHSLVFGQLMSISNAANSTIIGRQNKVVNSTNAFLLGSNLTTTSNDVVKIGFPGWNLVLKTNSLNIVSNGVAINVLAGGTGAPAGDYVTNGSSPTFSGQVAITNLSLTGSAIISATARDDVADVVTDSISFNPNGAASAGAKLGWLFGTYPVFADFVGTFAGSAANLTNFPANVNTNNGTLTGNVPLLGNGARGATNALNVTMGNGLLTLNTTNVISSSGSAVNNVRMTNGAITADSLNLTGTFTAATQNVTGTLTAGTIASTTVGNSNAPAWFNANGQLTNAASTGSGAVVLSSSPNTTNATLQQTTLIDLGPTRPTRNRLFQDAVRTPGLPVTVLQATETNSSTVLDLMPRVTGGVATTNWSSTGNVWIDLVDRDLTAPGINSNIWGVARIAIQANGSELGAPSVHMGGFSSGGVSTPNVYLNFGQLWLNQSASTVGLIYNSALHYGNAASGQLPLGFHFNLDSSGNLKTDGSIVSTNSGNIVSITPGNIVVSNANQNLAAFIGYNTDGGISLGRAGSGAGTNHMFADGSSWLSVASKPYDGSVHTIFRVYRSGATASALALGNEAYCSAIGGGGYSDGDIITPGGLSLGGTKSAGSGNVLASGTIAATNGIASYATPAVTPIASTGWTNIWSTNAAIVYFSATSCTWTNRQSDGTGIYTNETSATFNSQPVYLQPGERLNINGTSVTGIARKF